MFRKTILYFFIIGLVFLFLHQYPIAQKSENSNKPQKEEEKDQITYKVKVTVTTVDVVVTDKAGNRIKGLKQENFDVFEDGIQQNLTNFFEVKGMEVLKPVKDKKKEKPKPIPKPVQPPSKVINQVRNNVIFYFDNMQLHSMSRNWSIKKIKSFINNNFDSQSNNHGMVVCLDQELKILQRFTPHPTLLLGAMNKVKKRMGSSILRTREKEELRKELNRIVARSDKTNRYESFAQAQGIARSYVESVQHELFYSLKSLNAFTTHLAGIEGKKILIYISDGLPINPSEEIFSFLDQAFSFSDARNETLNYDATRIFKELTARCNANDISLYPVSAKGLESMILSADKQRGWNFHSRGSGMVKSGARAKSEGLKLLAKDTGGLAITNTNNIEKELKRVGKDLQFYYSLGYESLVGEDNKYHSIKVKLNGIKGKYNVRFKRGYKHISKKESIQEILNSRLFLKRNYNPMGIRVDVLSVKKTQYSKKLQLVLKLLIPIKNLLLYSQRGKHTGKIEVYVVLKDSKGFISSPYFLEKEVEIPKKDYKIAIKSFFPYLVEMYVEKDRYVFSIAVKDVNSTTINYIQLEKMITP